MAREGKSSVVPRLRFQEFRGAPVWTEARLDDLITVIAPPAKLQSTSYLSSGRFPIVDQSQQAISGWTDDATAVVMEPLPLIVFGDHTCTLKLLQQPFAQGADGIKILKAKAVVSTEYLFHSLSHRPLAMEDYKRHFSMLKERPVSYPDIKTGEQQKIADCLTSLDEMIAAQARKVEALKTYKRGLMQELFPRQGETIPRLRLPEFRNAPEWSEVAIGEMGEVITGNTPTTSQKEYYGGEHPFVSPADISDMRFVVRAKTNLSEAGFAQSRPIKARSVLFVCIGSTIGKVAQNAAECATNQQINSIVANSKYSGDFIYYLLRMESERIASLAGIQAVPIINKSVFSSVKVVAPKLAEQNRIADCLSSLDSRIAVESEKLDTLKIHKTALMQQLFPAPEEV